MKYPFQKKSFWIILVGFLSIIFLFPPTIGVRSVPSEIPALRYVDISDWEFLFNLRPYTTIRLTFLIFEIVLAFLLTYLGYLIFSKPEKK